MNRRTVLQSASVVTLAGLAGCVGAIESHFQGDLQSPVPLEITNEGDRSYNVQLEAHARGMERQTYDQGYTVTPGERVSAPHLEGSAQQFRVIRFDDDGDDDLVETGTISTSTKLVLINFDDDELDLEIVADEAEAENATDEDADPDAEQTDTE